MREYNEKQHLIFTSPHVWHLSFHIEREQLIVDKLNQDNYINSHYLNVCTRKHSKGYSTENEGERYFLC